MDGREAAFLEAFDEHHAGLFRFAYRLTGSVADAEDIVQECFLGLLRPACSYDPKRAPVRTYLFGAVRNQWLKRRPKDDLPVEVATPDLSPESAVLRTELKDVVARAVLQLPESAGTRTLRSDGRSVRLPRRRQVAPATRPQRARATLKDRLAAYAPSPERKV